MCTTSPTHGDNLRFHRALYELVDYLPDVNPAQDVLASTVGTAAMGSAIPPIVRIAGENFTLLDEVCAVEKSLPTLRCLFLHVLNTLVEVFIPMIGGSKCPDAKLCQL